MKGSESASSLLSKKKRQMKKVLQERRTSQDSFEKLRSNFELAVRLQPKHKLQRYESLERLKEDFTEVSPIPSMSRQMIHNNETEQSAEFKLINLNCTSVQPKSPHPGL